MGTLSVNTLRGRVCEVMETLSRRKVDVCCIQETRCRGGNCRTIKGKDTRYKLYWSGNDRRLKKDPDNRCTRCQGTACPLDGRPQKEVQVGPDKLEVIASFCYLGYMLSAAGGCELSTTTHVKTAWKKFKDLLPVLSSHHLSLAVCTALVCGALCSMPARLRH